MTGSYVYIGGAGLRAEPPGAIWIIDTATLQVKYSNVDLTSIGAIAVNPEGTELYFTDGTETLSTALIDWNRFPAVSQPTSVQLPFSGGLLALTSDGARLVVSDGWDSTTVVDTRTLAQAAPLAIPGGAGLAVTTDGQFAYFATVVPGIPGPPASVVKIDLQQNAVVETLPAAEFFGNALFGGGIASTPGGAQVFVADGTPLDTPGWTATSKDLDVIDTTGKLPYELVLPVGTSINVVVDSAGSAVYVANIDTISVVDPATRQLVYSVPNPDSVSPGQTMALTPDGKQLWVVNQQLDYDAQGNRTGGRVSVLDTTTKPPTLVMQFHLTGAIPTCLAIDGEPSPVVAPSITLDVSNDVFPKLGVTQINVAGTGFSPHGAADIKVLNPQLGGERVVAVGSVQVDAVGNFGWGATVRQLRCASFCTAQAHDVGSGLDAKDTAQVACDL